MLSRGSVTRVVAQRSSLFRFEGTAPGLPLWGAWPVSSAVRRRSVTSPRRDPRVLRNAQLLENCIASTSILKIPSYKEPTVDALAPDADEGRGWLR